LSSKSASPERCEGKISSPIDCCGEVDKFASDVGRLAKGFSNPPCVGCDGQAVSSSNPAKSSAPNAFSHLIRNIRARCPRMAIGMTGVVRSGLIVIF
jgi:hypothetical protein